MIRHIKPSHAEALASLITQVENEADYMLFEPGERQTTPEAQRKRIEAIKKEDNSTIIVAEKDNQLIGFLMAIGGAARRNNHSAYLVAGIASGHRGKGIGTKLFEELDRWAREHSIHRLELTTVVKNDAGVALYKKAGFKIEGTKKHSLLINGEFVDEYYMGKLLDCKK
ncbi:GNAT family N-acetyltransferase [Bacillus sp. ISL-47]|uniref:GNAT family N-acetyltransferase n=1 Tax=Bacillus sp. ISL-47 TaxID=2819130 RepID=UPI001BE6DB1D|nr:GNAT family N-acetyltransferase [Bacillus sp. ISL-47]MBT2690197.1 GNAT family N-acetyltransferase [Bacillus sp. ISL-47]MBT2710354.1 GNAT family N-acetyltransferase [Pseudomonas sp. ISL-84]